MDKNKIADWWLDRFQDAARNNSTYNKVTPEYNCYDILRLK